MIEFPAIDWGGLAPQTRVHVNPRARHVRLKVLPPGHVELVLPPRCDRQGLPAFVAQHRDWLLRNLERIRAEHALQQEARVAPPLIELTALAESWQVEYRTAGRGGVWERAGRGLLVQHRADAWEAVLRRWLMQKARAALEPWLAAVSSELGLPFNGLSIRGQKTRWGSCSARKTINLNYRLLFLPPELVRYLMVHELCHTVHMNHSPRYWRLVEQHAPDYREHDRALRHAGRQMPPWTL